MTLKRQMTAAKGAATAAVTARVTVMQVILLLAMKNVDIVVNAAHECMPRIIDNC